MASKITYLFFGILIGLVIIYVGTNYFSEPKNENLENEINLQEEHTEDMEMGEVSPNNPAEEMEADATFVLGGENFKFTMDGTDNPELIVNEGDVVKIELTSTSGFHDWVVDEFGAATDKVRDGNSTSVTFVADKKGTFEYYCSVGQHRANGMKGNLIVQ